MKKNKKKKSKNNIISLKQLKLDCFDKKVKEIRKLLEDEIEVNDDLICKLAEFKKDKEIKKIEQEKEDVTKRALVILTDKEKSKLDRFIKKHRKCLNKNSSELWYKIGWNGFGHEILVKCPKCNEELDITDVSVY